MCRCWYQCGAAASLQQHIPDAQHPLLYEQNICISHCRYSEIKERLTPFLRGCGYNPKKDLVFLPISGLLGHNIQKPVAKSMCSWYSVSSTYLCNDMLGRLQAICCMQPVAGRRGCAVSRPVQRIAVENAGGCLDGQAGRPAIGSGALTHGQANCR